VPPGVRPGYHRDVLRRIPPPSRTALVWLVGAALGGLLGALPGEGSPSAPAILAWLALWGPAAGAALGRLGVPLLPFALAVPASWSLLLPLAGFGLVTPLWALCAVAGLFATGHALGRLARVGPSSRSDPLAALRAAGIGLLAALAATGASVGFGLGARPTGAPPRWVTAALDVSPVGLVAECAGIDWARAQPEVYARSGVEWVPRRPWRGSLAAPTVLVVGCSLSWLAAFLRPVRRPET
jgi:hypothetical protein